MKRSMMLAALPLITGLLASQSTIAEVAKPNWDRGSATETELAGYQCAAALMVNVYGAKSDLPRYGEMAQTLEESGKLALLVGASETGRRTGAGAPLPLPQAAPILIGEAQRLKARWASDQAGVLELSRLCMQWADSVHGQFAAAPNIASKDITPPSAMPHEKLEPGIAKYLDDLATHSFNAWQPGTIKR